MSQSCAPDGFSAGHGFEARLIGVKPEIRAGTTIQLTFLTGTVTANIMRCSPFDDDLFEDIGESFRVKPVVLQGETELAMKIDVKEDDRAFTVRADIPGVKKEDIQIDVEDDLVSLRAEMKQEKEEKKDEKVVYSERRYGVVSRSFTLPAGVDAKGARAEYKDGVLNLMLPKKANGGGKRIAVS